MKRNSPPVPGQSYLIVMRKFSLKEAVLVIAYFSFLISLLPLQYDNIRWRTFLYPIIWFSVLFVVYKTFFERSKERYAIGKVGGILTFILFLSYIPDLVGFCAWSTTKVIYVNKTDRSDRIISRSYSCYMTDSDVEWLEQRRITNHISWVSSFNKIPIDTTKWEAHYDNE